MISSGYGQGTSFTNTQGPSGMDVSPYLMALLQAEQRHMSQRSAPAAPAIRRSAPLPMMGPGREGDRSRAMQDKLMAAQVSKAQSEANALRSTTPTRMATVGGQTFATPDPLMMTGAQRAMFLPGNSTMIPSQEKPGSGPVRVYGGPQSAFDSEEDEGFEQWKYQQALKARR